MNVSRVSLSWTPVPSQYGHIEQICYKAIDKNGSVFACLIIITNCLSVKLGWNHCSSAFVYLLEVPYNVYLNGLPRRALISV